MKRFFKWLAGGLAVLLLAGLSVFYGRFFFSDAAQRSSLISQATEKLFSLKQSVWHTIPAKLRSGAAVVTFDPAPGRPEGELTPAEQSVKERLEEMLKSGEATHRVVYDGVKTMTGRLVEEHPDYILFSQSFGDSGTMSVKLPRSRIVRIETSKAEHPVISRRDIHFHMEFPDSQFYKNPPYTLITEESFFAVEHIVKQLQDLYAQITEQFSPLIASSARRDDIQLLIFSDAGKYEAYRSRYAPELKGSCGFYSLGMDRMAAYHQRDADWVKDGNKQISAVEKKYKGKLRTEKAQESFRQWKLDARGQLLGEADKATQAVIRHEGAHQLLFTLGVQNPYQNGRNWVTEGLATYCETEKPGRLNTLRIADLKPALAGSRLIPLRSLMATRRCESTLAYAEAWSLTHMLMQPEYRSGFFAWLDWLRKNPAVPVGDPVEELCRFLPLQPAELQSHWMAYINRLEQK